MGKTPFSNDTITNKDELYGRDALLKKLINAVDIFHYNVNIVGCRRFGKTCFLDVLKNSIRDKAEANSYPIYVDAKSWNIGLDPTGKIGTANVYKFLLSILLETLTQDSIITEPEIICGLNIVPVSNRHVYFSTLSSDIDRAIPDIFAEVVRFYSMKMNKTIVFLFDEYEFLMSKGFGEPTGFQTLRKLTAENIDGFRPCSFLVAGAVMWRHLCSTIGSKELNTIGSHIYYIKPLKKNDFCDYWQAECEKINDKKLKDIMLSKCEYIYEQTGGVVFHANDLGANILLEDGEYPNDFFANMEEIFESLNFKQKEMLVNIAMNPQGQNFAGGDLIYLRSLGIVSATEIEIPIKSLHDWIIDDSHLSGTNHESYLDTINDEINNLMEAINDTAYNKSREFVFKPHHKDATLIKNRRTPCGEQKTFGIFIDAIWKTHYEKTKDEKTQKTKALLPDSYKETYFTNVIATLRHTYSGHLYGEGYRTRPGQLTKENVLNALLGSENEPYDRDFLTLQRAVLDLHRRELDGILREVRTWTVS